MASDTRALLLDKAEALFAERGFYGTSIAAIASELSLTKQALLHHFGSKEKLYGAVLKRISDQFEPGLDLAEQSSDPEHVLIDYFLKLQSPASNDQTSTRVLMRELLDNKHRADTAGTWYLKAFLERLIAMVKAIPNWQSATDAEAFALIYQILGAINYFGISEPTLKGIFGEAMFKKVETAFPGQLETLMVATLRARQV